jgi:hypothetical protein
MMWTGSCLVFTVGGMEEYYPGIRRVCVAVEAEPSGGHSVMEHAIARRDMSRLLASLCGAPAFLELSLSQQRTGDSDVIVFPVGIDEPRILTLLVRWVTRAVYRANTGWDSRRLRLRMAAHEGVTTLVAGVFDGPAVLEARALVTAAPLRAVLAAAPSADLAVLFSSRLRDDLSGFDECLDVSDFTQLELQPRPGAGAEEPGWLLVPESDHLMGYRRARVDSDEGAQTGPLPG